MPTDTVLVAYGSKSGGTEGIAQTVAGVLRSEGFAVEVRPAAAVRRVDHYDAVLLGGALYGGRWYREARRFARRHAAALRGRPVWLFSSGPLDRSAQDRDIPPTRSVAEMARAVGARGHATFGGMLGPESHGWIARKMVSSGRAGDFRDTAQIRTWATAVAADLGAPAGSR